MPFAPTTPSRHPVDTHLSRNLRTRFWNGLGGSRRDSQLNGSGEETDRGQASSSFVGGGAVLDARMGLRGGPGRAGG